MSTVPDSVAALWQGKAARLLAFSQVTHALGMLAPAFGRGGRTPYFWFPDYFCDGALALLRRHGVRLGFYPVGLDLKPDWAACRDACRTNPPDFFVLVHYFGVANDIEGARAFCDAAGARLVEDATQLLLPGGDVGRLGDFVCYGPRKFFDIPDGGLLAVRSEDDAAAIEAALASAPRATPPTWRWRVKAMERGIRRRLPRRTRHMHLPPVRLDTVNPEPLPFAEPLMSAYAMRRLDAALGMGRLAAIAERRRRHADRVAALTENLDGVSPIDRRAGAISCWEALSCRDRTRAQTALDHMRAAGFPAVPWPNQLPPEVLSQPAHERAVRLRGTSLIINPRGTDI